jgi:PelA/Pel-15E family pectate lyase
MKIIKNCLWFALFVFIVIPDLLAQNNRLVREVEQTMLRATQFIVEKASTNGGYVWYYRPDFSRQWGEMEAYKTMIWLQHPGTVSMGHLFMDAYRATGNEYYYQAAAKAAAAIIWGQSDEGGWNYMIDFAGDRSLKQWYKTIGKNGWRLEEFQYYYGNSTFDDDITSDAARFLLRMYLEKMDPAYKPALDKAIGFILESQYPLGGWPQRYPLKYDFNKQEHHDYTSFYTFNDEVIWENTHFLIQCYLTLGEERFLDPIRRGMNFYIISQDACGAWGQQLNMALETAGARTYEPIAFLPSTTFENAMLMLKFYEYTGDKKFLRQVPAAISWLEKTEFPKDKIEDGQTHPTFVEIVTNKPVYAHRKGSNVKYGYYYIDYNDDKLLSHYHGKHNIQLEELKKEYNRLVNLPLEEVTKNSPLNVDEFKGEGSPQRFYELNRNAFHGIADEFQVKKIIQSLDNQNRWLVKHARISHPYIGDGQNQEPTDKYASTNVGDETDTSPYPDPSDQDYISTSEYINNMNILINYIQSSKSVVGSQSDKKSK